MDFLNQLIDVDWMNFWTKLEQKSGNFVPIFICLEINWCLSLLVKDFWLEESNDMITGVVSDDQLEILWIVTSGGGQNVSAIIAPLFARRGGFNANDITKIALTIVSIIFSSASNWDEFVRDTIRLGVCCRKLERLLRFLSIDPKQFIELVNEGIKSCINPGIKATLNESISSWLRNYPGALYTNRNPNPEGFWVFMLAFELTWTQRNFTLLTSFKWLNQG